MSNQVILNKDGFIEQIYKGDQTEETASYVIGESNKLVEQLLKENKPVFILIDVSDLGKSPAAVRLKALKALRQTPYRKIAVCSTNTATKALANLVIYGQDRTDVAKVFDTRTEASQWLKNMSGNK